jgi:pimeloyl-ACP methyl ester carboxylesterase
MTPPTTTRVTSRPEARLSGLITDLTLCQPLICAATVPLRTFPAHGGPDLDDEGLARCVPVLDAIGAAGGLATPQVVAGAPGDVSSLDVALSRYLDPDGDLWPAIAACPVDRVPAVVAGQDTTTTPARHRIAGYGTPRFTTFTRGDSDADAVVIVPPCGVPATAFHPFLIALSDRYLVLTYENPYLFAERGTLNEPMGDLDEDAAMVRAALDEHGIARAHLVGICGGAPVALAAAGHPAVVSVTVCHPDLNFGAAVERSRFQKHFQGMLAEARSSGGRTAETHRLFLDPDSLFGIPERLAPFILYPYADVELFRRYATINHGFMAYDANAAASELDRPLLILTSASDRMTHPAGARRLHELVAGSVLQERDSGSHHDVLLPTPVLFDTIRTFVGSVAAARSGGQA